MIFFLFLEKRGRKVMLGKKGGKKFKVVKLWMFKKFKLKDSDKEGILNFIFEDGLGDGFIILFFKSFVLG